MTCKYIFNNKEYTEQEFRTFVNDNFINTGKVRRNLETQSDLFQKGRNKDDLVTKITGQEYAYESNNQFYVDGLNYYLDSLDGESEAYFKGNDVRISSEEYYTAYKKSLKEIKGDSSQNQFLQLLNKDNNWVTFFVRAIIQQTAKERIYEASLPDIEEKVLSLQKEGKLKIDCK